LSTPVQWHQLNKIWEQAGPNELERGRVRETHSDRHANVSFLHAGVQAWV